MPGYGKFPIKTKVGWRTAIPSLLMPSQSCGSQGRPALIQIRPHDSRGFDDAILQIKHGHHVSDTIINRFGE